VVEDWTAVAKAISSRAADLDLRQKDLADRSGVSLAIIREIQQDRIHRRRNPRTLEALSTALGWHPHHLGALLAGEEPPARGASQPASQDRVVVLLDAILRELRGLRTQIGTLNRRIEPSTPTEMRNKPKKQ
jgi:transcriptional regulator with XRE-family HTH domain